MIAAVKYQKIAAELRAKARKESSEHAKAELESLAACYSIMARRAREIVDKPNCLKAGPTAAP
jgi:hypothetical protein